MDISLEPPLAATRAEDNLAGRSLEEWNAAYVKVESYLHALRVRNRVVLGRLVGEILKRAQDRAPDEPGRSATELAGEEMNGLITEWFGQILREAPTGADQMLSTRGRLALLLADMPGRWQDQFLRPGPWPGAFVASMRETFLRAGPDFQLSKMAPRPLDLGPITALTRLGRLPYLRMVAIWLAFGFVLVVIFKRSH
jgi:hypothetical protein